MAIAAGAVIETVPVAVLPPARTVGLTENADKVAGLTVKVAVSETVPYVAVTTELCAAVTAVVEAWNVTDDFPAAIKTTAGTVTYAVALLFKLTVTPPVGAGPFRVSVPTP